MRGRVMQMKEHPFLNHRPRFNVANATSAVNTTASRIPLHRTLPLRAAPLLVVAALIAAVIGPVAGVRAAQTGQRNVTASVTCDDGGAQPEVHVTIANQTGAPLQVSYVHGFTTPQATAILMRMVDPGKVRTSVVPANGSRTLSAPWDDLRDGEGYTGGALVVTSLGVL